jgi:hypothetical protein
MTSFFPSHILFCFRIGVISILTIFLRLLFGVLISGFFFFFVCVVEEAPLLCSHFEFKVASLEKENQSNSTVLKR